MLDFIKAINSKKIISSEEIYEIFKTDSFDLNLKFLSNVQKHKTVNEFFDYYSKLDFKNVLNVFDNLNSLTVILSNDRNKNIFGNKIDKYLYDVSKIIMFFLLIEKTNEILNNFITNAKTTINDFCLRNESSSISTNINNCFNNIINFSPVLQRSLSRRATKERTLSSYNNQKEKENSVLLDITKHDDNELIVLGNNTPKFKEKEWSKASSLNDKKDNSVLKSSQKTIDSILSLRNMKFMHDEEEKNPRGIKKKNKTIRFGFNKQEPENFLKQKSNSNKIYEYLNNMNDINSSFEYNPQCIDKSQLLANLLNIINFLFTKGKINEEQKLKLKKLLISDSENVINRFNKYYESTFPFNNNLKNLFKKFLIAELDSI
jgi:hypothetical protein